MLAQSPSAAKPQPKVGIFSRKGAKAAKGELCHFDRREKSFSDPSPSFGMTGLAQSLGVLGVINFLEVVLFNKGNESVFHFHEDSSDRSH
jgi:hypothetical protein